MTTALLFDLDGTLWDASESTARAWTEVFDQYGLPSLVTSDQIRGVAGKPYLECLRIICPQALEVNAFDNLLAMLAKAEKYWMKKLGGTFYPGALDAVFNASKKIPVFLISNCNGWYLEAFLDHSKLRPVFSDAICFGNTGRPKAENIRFILDKFKISNGFYIGDTRGDMEASVAAGIPYVHVALGFGGPNMENSWHTLSDYREFPVLVQRIGSIS